MPLLLALLLAAAPFTGAQRDGKDALSPAQKKIDSQLLQLIRAESNSGGRGSARPDVRVRIDEKKRALVDIRVPVTSAARKAVTDLDGTIVSTSVEYHSIVAWLPLTHIETLAEREDVHSVVPAPDAATNR